MRRLRKILLKSLRSLFQYIQKGKMPNSKGMNLKDSIANESIDEFLKRFFKK
jgi:hypothetical protein